jgi:hypothetical protein
MGASSSPAIDSDYIIWRIRYGQRAPYPADNIPRKDSIIELEIYPNLPDETVPVFILKCLWGLDNLGVIAAHAQR